MEDWLRSFWRRRHRVSPSTPLKGLTDNPSYQWWRDPLTVQRDSWWGTAHDANALADQTTLMRELGVQLFRFEVPWRELAPMRPGSDSYDGEAAARPDWAGYRWSRLDAIVEELDAAAITPVPVVVFAPDWALGDAGNGPASPPSRPEYFADIITALVRRYRGRVPCWELWNEPDHPHSWTAGFNEYVRLVLRPGAGAIRAASPECKVLMGGLADHRNLESIHRAGAANLYDVANIHLYPTRASPRRLRTAVNRAHAVLAHIGARSLWVTECGIATRPPSLPSGFGGVTDEAGQARFVSAIYETVAADAVFLYQLRDTAIHDASGRLLKEVYWGLVSNDCKRRKPGFDAYRRVVSRRQVSASQSAPRTESARPKPR